MTSKNELKPFREKGRFKVSIEMKKIGMNDPFTVIPPAEKMVIFLKQHMGVEAKPIVKKGDIVKYGQKIGDYDSDNSMMVPIHSPVNGKIIEIRKIINPHTNKEENAIIIKKSDDKIQPIFSPLNDKEATAKELLNRIREAGIVGLGGAAFPTFVKLNQKSKMSHLIINAKESDPNITADICLIKEKPNEIIDGIKIIEKILNPEKVIFATRADEGEIKHFEQLAKDNGIIVQRIRPNYSVGSEKLLVKELLEKEVPAGKFPPEIGIVVQNIATAYAIWDAVHQGNSLVSRILTVYSEKTQSKNYLVRMGTPVNHILNHLGISTNKINHIVLGSIFMGPSISDPDIPVLKATSGITVFGEEHPYPYDNPKPCIRCSYCNIVCPVDIYPQLIMESVIKQDKKMLKKLHVEVCIDCGLCSYVCPSKIILTKFLQYGKKIIRE